MNYKYQAEIDSVSKAEWSDLLKDFEDATIYQTWSYGAARWGEKNLSHLILKRNDEIIGLAQLSIVKLPFINAGIAYIPWGPVWHKRGQKKDPETVGQMLKLLKKEYVVRHGLLLRMMPNEITGESDWILSILEKEGFHRQHKRYRSILIDLSPSLDQLRSNFKKAWRAKLESAERKKLEVIEGTDDQLYDTLSIPYYEMIARKNFIPGLDIEEFRKTQNDLPDFLKMKIMVCLLEGKPVGSLLASLIGDKGIFILGGNNEIGLRHGASHLLPWRMVEWMKAQGARWCDLGGFNPNENPGTAHFKKGLSGRDIIHIGQFETCRNFLSTWAVDAGERLKVSREKVTIYTNNVRSRLFSLQKQSSHDEAKNILDTLEERGFVEQVTDSPEVRKMTETPITCYVGFDPTAKSLHIGNLIPIMALAHVQRAGHRPIAIIGGATALVGDPSGKTETRPIMTMQEIENNAEGIKAQLSRFIDLKDGKALMLNNADWLTGLNYIDFLRDIGGQFSVNRMLAAESYRSRLETGLNFIEFNYMLLQAYDFLHLYDNYDCRLQMGGNDQWGNILAGVDLIRRLDGTKAQGLTFPLITTSSGVKMGKTHKGTVWLDPDLTSPYEYYQYWINQDDADIEHFLAIFTFLSMTEINKLGKLKGADIRAAKEILAYEATKECHGPFEADKARNASRQLFGNDEFDLSDGMPSCTLSRKEIEQGISAYILFEKAGLCKTRSEARRLISQGGAYINHERIDDADLVITAKYAENETLLLRAGKKKYISIKLK